MSEKARAIRKRIPPDDNPNHRMGKKTGYSEVDGRIYLAPTYIDELRQIREDRYSAKEIFAQAQEVATKHLMACTQRNNRIWRLILDDLQLDVTKEWRINLDDGCVFPAKDSPGLAASLPESEGDK